MKSILVWILLIALPVQGFAGVATSMCGHANVAMATAAIAVETGHGATAPASAGECGHDQASVQPAQTATGCDSPSDETTCSACGACSVGAAASTAFAALPAFNTHGAERIPYVATHDTACIYGALERPPHTLA